MSIEQIFELIREERAHQDAKWGGPEHDAQFTADLWLTLVRRHLQRADERLAGLVELDGNAGPGFPGALHCFVSAAALLVSAMENCPDFEDCFPGDDGHTAGVRQ